MSQLDWLYITMILRTIKKIADLRWFGIDKICKQVFADKILMSVRYFKYYHLQTESMYTNVSKPKRVPWNKPTICDYSQVSSEFYLSESLFICSNAIHR